MANGAVYWRIFVYDAGITYSALLLVLACFDCPPQFPFIFIDDLIVLATIQLQADIRLGYWMSFIQRYD
jgi:hypothetical protein